jgi:hypothetical protein
MQNPFFLYDPKAETYSASHLSQILYGSSKVAAATPEEGGSKAAGGGIEQLNQEHQEDNDTDSDSDLSHSSSGSSSGSDNMEKKPHETDEINKRLLVEKSHSFVMAAQRQVSEALRSQINLV